MKKTLRYPCELLLKAVKLIQHDQIRKISDILFIVRGTRHNPLCCYPVEKLESGAWICNCDDFKKRTVEICSHVIAVMALQSAKPLRTAKRHVQKKQ